MASASLGLPEKTTLLVLVIFGRPVTNPQIDERFNFVIKKAAREKLHAAGYLELSTGPHNAFVHELTEPGWAAARKELMEIAPDKAPKAYRLLYGFMNFVGHYMSDTQTTLADLVVANQRAAVAEKIRSTYEELATRPGGWVALHRLRTQLPALSRSAMDDALQRLALLPTVHLVPEANQKTLTEADRAAAITIGGQDKHLLAMEHS
jgi:hypothetical protein